MVRNVISFRPDQETQEILNKVAKEIKVSDFIREAVKFYYQHTHGQEVPFWELKETVRELRQVVEVFQQVAKGVNFDVPGVNESSDQDAGGDDFMNVFLNIGQQFEALANEASNDNNSSQDVKEDGDDIALVDDNEIEFL